MCVGNLSHRNALLRRQRQRKEQQHIEIHFKNDNHLRVYLRRNAYMKIPYMEIVSDLNQLCNVYEEVNTKLGSWGDNEHSL